LTQWTPPTRQPTTVYFIRTEVTIAEFL
jgi:hypothetical protein